MYTQARRSTSFLVFSVSFSDRWVCSGQQTAGHVCGTTAFYMAALRRSDPPAGRRHHDPHGVPRACVAKQANKRSRPASRRRRLRPSPSPDRTPTTLAVTMLCVRRGAAVRAANSVASLCMSHDAWRAMALVGSSVPMHPTAPAWRLGRRRTKIAWNKNSSSASWRLSAVLLVRKSERSRMRA